MPSLMAMFVCGGYALHTQNFSPIFPLLWNGPWGNCRRSCCLVWTRTGYFVVEKTIPYCLKSFSFDSDRRDFLSSCPKWIFLPIKGFLSLFANYGTEYESNWIVNFPIPPNCKNRKWFGRHLCISRNHDFPNLRPNWISLSAIKSATPLSTWHFNDSDVK